MIIQKQYESYLRDIYRKRDGNPLTESSLKHYAGEAIRKISEMIRSLSNGKYDSVYDITSLDELLSWKETLMINPEFRKLDDDGNRMYSAGMNRYLEFAKGYCFFDIEDKIQLLDTPVPVKPSKQLWEKEIAARNRILVVQSREACSYKCQIDPRHETFFVESKDDKDNKLYVEGHHIIPLSMQSQFSNSLDCYANILILCPTCHRLMHYGRKREKEKILDRLYDERSERYSHSGLEMSRGDFISLINSQQSNFIY